jgi:membrane fusion protein, adhesin transport system
MAEVMEPLAHGRAEMPASRYVPVPWLARRVAGALLLALVTFGVLALVAPWQQNLRGSGRVIAYAPFDRQQNIDAPVEGRVVQWFVQEGSVVRPGDRIAEIADNDPMLMERLNFEREALQERLEVFTQRVQTANNRFEALERAQGGALKAAEARVRVARQQVAAAEQAEEAAAAALEAANLQLNRRRALVKDGLASQRDLELAILGEASTRTDRASAMARVLAAQGELLAREADLSRVREDTRADIEAARAAYESAKSDAAEARAAVARLDVRISRQQAQVVTAPRAGTILRLTGGQGGEQVKPTMPIAVLVPDTVDRAVELWVHGNDAALISPGRHVRLQFEGWPAVQFAGWPSVAVGTFGGRVGFVDATDDGKGRFRVVVVPDPEDEDWPSAQYLRQGVRAKGWVLLEQVRLGFELWRQFNGFPPALDVSPEDTPKGAS